MTPIMQTHFRTCNLCEAMCGLEIQYREQEVISIKGDQNDPFSRGHICPKALGLKDIYEDKDRLKHPIKKTEQGWVRISWEEALEEVVKNIKSIQAKYNDPNVVGIYLGNPTAHNSGSILMGPQFTRSLKTKNRFSATSVDQLPHHFAAFYMYGHQLLIPVPDIDHTHYFLILGANPLASNGSLMTAPNVAERLKNIQQKGGKVVVIDPRRTETARKADEHLFIRPGSDVLFLLALIHTLYQEKLVNLGRLADFTEGLDRIEALVRPYSPEKVSTPTGIPAEKIREIALEFAQSSAAVCYGRMGVSTQAFGSLCQWLIQLINILTGNLDRRGGVMFPLPAVDVPGLTGLRGSAGSHGRWTSRVRALPEFGGELPCSVMAEEMLTPGEGQIRAMVTVAGNPVLSTPNGTQLEKALEGLEFMVSVDIYINETSRHAHIILPPTTGLENDHYDVIFHYLAVRNTAKYSPRLFEPEKGTLADWQIFRALAQKMNALEANQPTDKSKSKDPTQRLSPEGVLDLALRFGPYGSKGSKFYGTLPFGETKQGLKLQTLRQQPHGIDLGPMQPCLPQRLFTPKKKIQAVPEIFLPDLERVQNYFFGEKVLSTDASYDLLLIGRRHLRSNNSWMHNSLRLVKGPNRCTLMIHPEKAAEKNLAQGEMVKVCSRVGFIEIEVEITEDIMPGVLSIPHGWGHHRPGIQWQIARQFAGVSINDLTDEQFLDPLSGNAAFSGVPVRIEKIKK
ncbi:MAG: molybdopterin oxidoreductase family protein [Microscillaceae bacterium]|nr:molybdopterin oxidoreductase family protein [Microscillaceae bacterium]